MSSFWSFHPLRLAKNQGLEIPGEFCEFEQGQHSKPQKRQKRQKGREIGSGWGCSMFEGSWRWKPWFSECVLQVFPNTNPLNWTSDTFHREMLEKYVWGDHVNNSNIQLWSENHFICWVWFRRICLMSWIVRWPHTSMIFCTFWGYVLQLWCYWSQIIYASMKPFLAYNFTWGPQ